MDFFSAQHGSQPSSTTVNQTIDPFAQEIGRRFSLPAGQPMLTARLSPIASSVPSLPTPQARLDNLSLRSKPSSPVRSPPTSNDGRITAIVPATLLAVLNTPHVLVLDIRPHATFAQSRLPHAVSLSVPSTLLKRPAFPLHKLTEMLPSSSARRHFSAWKSASRILVYDADSISMSETSTLRGLLRKFENEGFRGDIAWLKGGFAGVWREARVIVDNGPPTPESSEEDDVEAGYLRARNLPSSAFQQVSTTSAAARPSTPPPPAHHRTVAPAPTSTRPVAANPFYDNIRQNRELEHGITERIPLRLPASVLTRRDDLPFDWLKEIVDKADAEEGTEALAMQFYMIELREQRRLMGVMDHHSHPAYTPEQRANFPYSITAGVEKGSKNRYTNIWPFEHARVRLGTLSLDDGSDYINASYVQPLGTTRRYIATQGPLPTTYNDFWTLCWEQNISVIVMLTKEIEGSLVKCGSYWTHHSYGPLRLDLISSTGPEPIHTIVSSPGFDFGVSTGIPMDPHKATIRRTFRLSHTEHPELPLRTVTQLQYLAWPDFDVPDDPRGLLRLMREVDVLRTEAEAEQGAGPVLLHCSAGIGRTGGFIVVDAALDGIRREIRQHRAGKPHEPNLDALLARTQERLGVPFQRDVVLSASIAPMDVDSSPEGEESVSQLTPEPAAQWRDVAPRHRPRGFPIRNGHNDSSGTDTSAGGDELRTRSLSPGPSVPGTVSSSSTGPLLRPSAFSADADLRSQPKRIPRTPPRMSLTLGLSEPEPAPASAAEALSRFRSELASGSRLNGVGTAARAGESSASPSTANLPSVFSLSLPTDKSTQPSSFPNSVESSRSPSPSKDAEHPQLPTTTTFDYTDPRRLHDDVSPELLSSYAEPVRKMLEDMREQRMSLCQSLRQYVFVHRAIVEGALDIMDEERALEMDAMSVSASVSSSPSKGKRGPSPTELSGEDRTGAVRLSKRPSIKRGERSDASAAAVEL